MERSGSTLDLGKTIREFDEPAEEPLAVPKRVPVEEPAVVPA